MARQIRDKFRPVCYIAAVNSTLLVVLAALAVTNAALEKTVTAPDREFTDSAIALEKAGANFDQIFAKLCRQALDKAATNSQVRLDDCARFMFGGLWRWATTGGHPKFQNQSDKAQHFIGGGAFEGYFDLGPRAAVTKERLDSTHADNRFDLDDLAATLFGARWMEIATAGDAAQTKRWLELWATGKLTLSGSLPKMEFGQMPQFAVADGDRVQKVRDFVNAALQPPPKPASPEPPHH